MRWLAIDTSGGTTVGVVEAPDGGGLAEISCHLNPDPRGHVEALAPMIERALEDAGVRPSDIDAVVAGTGPAPFTGLRVGIASAVAFARGAGCDVRGVSSLDAIAWAATGSVVVTTDARRREVYWAAYEDGLGPADVDWCVHGPAVGPPSDVLDWLSTHRSRAVGPGTALYPELAGEGSEEPTVTPAGLVAVACARKCVGAPTPLTPLYLRRPDVHVGTGRKRAT
jgi:tRNA threonylcarbamoyladenosine biosynthesis protein TsaB